MVADIERASGNGMCTVLLALDITAAFDAVNHLILYRRIESDFGVAGMELSWLRSFVSYQSQYVAVGSVRSETCALSSGVPQGSVLGPLLFVMYVSEIDAVIRSHSFQYHQYADDLMIYMSLIPKAFDDLSYHLLAVLKLCRRGSCRTRCVDKQKRPPLARVSG